MSKIIKVINVMISNTDYIDNVIQNRSEYDNNEIFFLYNEKHKWSILKDNTNNYYLHYYQGDLKLNDLAAWDSEQWNYFNDYVSYSTKNMTTKEALDSLSELYRIVRDKLHGMDDVFDDIIGDDFF